MRQFTEDVLLLQCLNKGMLEFVRHKITALGIGADLQSVSLTIWNISFHSRTAWFM